MYSKERAPRAAQAAVEAVATMQQQPPHLGRNGTVDDGDSKCSSSSSNGSVRIAILLGGFQQVMAKRWVDGVADQPRLFASVRREQWVENGRQGLVWLPDLRMHER